MVSKLKFKPKKSNFVLMEKKSSKKNSLIFKNDVSSIIKKGIISKTECKWTLPAASVKSGVELQINVRDQASPLSVCKHQAETGSFIISSFLIKFSSLKIKTDSNKNRPYRLHTSER